MYRFFFLSPQNIPYFSSRLMLPLPASIAKDKENGTNNPVHRHGDPDTEDAESHTHTEHIAHADSADHMERIERIMQNATSLDARSTFGRLKAIGQIIIQQMPW